jgi:hypothetical protein
MGCAELRQQSIVVDKVRGVKDESDALIRLADAIAGFVRHSLDQRHAGLQAMRCITRHWQREHCGRYEKTPDEGGLAPI